MKIILAISILFFINSTLAISGVTPGSYEINFKPFLEKNFTFNFLFDEGVNSKLYVEGELAKYVFLDKTEITGSEKVVVNLKLPEIINLYGENKIRIGAKQFSSGTKGVGIISDARGIIKVFVPYPGKNAIAEINIPDGNIGENLKVILKITNKGNESILAKPIVQIFKGKEIVADLNFKETSIEPLASYKEEKFLATENFSFGEYGGVVLVDYKSEDFARDEVFFKLGKLFVEIVNNSKEINKSELEKFDIEIESFWNNKIKDSYAEVSFDNKTFSSSLINLNPWEKKKISVIVDSSEIKSKEKEFLITLYYENSSTSKTTLVKIINPQRKLYFLLSTLLIAAVLFFIYWKIKYK